MLRIISSAAASDEPGSYPVSLFPDELDRTYSAHSAGSQDDLTIILNAGYKRGAAVVRAHKDKQTEVIRYDCFAPVAFAGLATARLPDALVTRTFVVHTKRATRDERPASFLPVAHDRDLLAVRESLSRWAAEVAERISEPADMLAILLDERITAITDGRDHEIWSCLFTVATLAGGVWPVRCIEAVTLMQEESADHVSGSPSARLLAAIRRHYMSRPASRWNIGISKDDIVSAALEMDALTFERFNGRDEVRPDDIGALLREHGLKSIRIRAAHGRAYGYRWADLEDAWSRVLPPPVEDTDDEDEEPPRPGSVFAR
ncbi:DUF3631 domain-containing protein [Kitasatospora sp. NPDC101801]|uniref:DUF3631 domain-containing protein n=1 Tax=Kitasatospora sp. NPDC101801 TaxID=3364103 RepID=UPI003812977F